MESWSGFLSIYLLIYFASMPHLENKGNNNTFSVDPF